jgi:hypothetical protein
MHNEKQWLIFDKLEGAHIGERAIIDADGFTICNPSPMGEHNARLIAAAPQLADAVAGLLQLYVDCDTFNNQEDYETVRAARAVLRRLEVQ